MQGCPLLWSSPSAGTGVAMRGLCQRCGIVAQFVSAARHVSAAWLLVTVSVLEPLLAGD